MSLGLFCFGVISLLDQVVDMADCAAARGFDASLWRVTRRVATQGQILDTAAGSDLHHDI